HDMAHHRYLGASSLRASRNRAAKRQFASLHAQPSQSEQVRRSWSASNRNRQPKREASGSVAIGRSRLSSRRRHATSNFAQSRRMGPLQAHVSFSGGKISTFVITSFTSLASLGNRGKDSNRALQFGQSQRWRMSLSSSNSVLRGAMISWSHRTQWIP